MSIKTREISSIKMVLKPTFEVASEILPELGAGLLSRALPGDLPVLPSISSISLSPSLTGSRFFFDNKLEFSGTKLAES